MIIIENSEYDENLKYKLIINSYRFDKTKYTFLRSQAYYFTK